MHFVTLLCLFALTLVHTGSSKPLHHKRQSRSFFVDGTNIPGVPFTVPDSYSGILPTLEDETLGGLFFWYHPATPDSAGQDDITVWVQGGSQGGCSSLLGMMQETGPWIFPPNQDTPILNPYSWTNISNVLYVELPAGTGFSNGVPEHDAGEVAETFYTFLTNFFKTFPDLHGKRLWFAGDGRAAWYLSYIMQHIQNFHSFNEDNGINLQGFAFYGPYFSEEWIQRQVPVVEFATAYEQLMGLNDSFIAQIHSLAVSYGIDNAVAEQLQYPPLKTTFDNSTVNTTATMEDLYHMVLRAAEQGSNPCFSANNIAYTCPRPLDVLGAPPVSDRRFKQTSNRINFINDTPGFKAYIHANVSHLWYACDYLDFNYRQSVAYGPPTGNSGVLGLLLVELPAPNNLIINGELDFIAMPDATALALQFVEWYDYDYTQNTGFQTSTQTPLIVDGAQVGSLQSKTNLTFVRLDNVGHRVALDAPETAFKLHQYFLGQIDQSVLYIP